MELEQEARVLGCRTLVSGGFYDGLSKVSTLFSSP